MSSYSEDFINGGGLAQVFASPTMLIFHWLLTIAIIIVMIAWFVEEKKKSEKKEGLQYLGAKHFGVRDDTGFPNGDKVAESALKNNFTEKLVEAGREPNLYNMKEPEVTTAPSSTGPATGFRDRMGNEEELAKYLNQ